MSNKYKVFVVVISIFASSSLISCSKDSSNFESQVKSNFFALSQKVDEQNFQIAELSDQVQVLKTKLNLSVSELNAEDIKFQSIEFSSPEASLENGVLKLRANQPFSLNIDILNSSDKDAVGFVCQLIFEEFKGDTVVSKTSLDNVFEALPKSLRSDISFGDSKTPTSKGKYLLRFVIKDSNKTIVTEFEQKTVIE